MTDKPRRPVVGSRNPTGRPRRIAGQTGAEPTPPPPEATAEPRPERSRGLGGRRTTVALVAAVVVLLLVAAAEVVYLTRDATPTLSAGRPVVTGQLTHRAAVEAAARSTEEILSTGYEDYDEQVDQATAKMTDAFAEQYRQTSAGIRDSFLAAKTKLQVQAVAQGVVQASPAQVQALLFLDQYVEKTEKGQPRTDYRQYRALVTVVHTDQGWLVSNIETQ
jgi:Mce-associated membrane protein